MVMKFYHAKKYKNISKRIFTFQIQLKFKVEFCVFMLVSLSIGLIVLNKMRYINFNLQYANTSYAI